MLPSRVNICGIPHTVEVCDDKFNSDLHLGMIEYEKANIKINGNATEELQMQSLFHEMLHGMLIMIGRNDESMDEVFVQSLANAMYQSFDIRRSSD